MNKAHIIDDINSIDTVSTGDYRLNQFDLPYAFYLKRNKNSKKLMIFSQGAVDRKTKTLPNYQRISWVEDYDSNIIIFQDPTLYLTDKLRIGWYQGTAKQNATSIIIKIIKRFRESMNIKNENIIFYGSSAGGFASLMFAAYFKNCQVVVNNPQTDITKYDTPHVKTMLSAAFPKLTINEYLNLYEKRCRVASLYKIIGHIPNITYLQNVNDVSHLNNHCMPFINEISSLQCSINSNQFNINLKLYSNIKECHNPMGRKKTMEVLKPILSKVRLK